MDWVTIATLIAQYGIPLAEELVSKWENKSPVTLSEFQSLKAKASQSAFDQMKALMVAQGMDPNSSSGAAILNLVK